MDPKLCLCIFLTVAISYVSGCGLTRNYEETTFEKSVYVSVTTRSYMRAYMEFMKYSFRGNDRKSAFHLGGLILQVERPCNGSMDSKKMVFSKKLPSMFTNNPPQPNSKMVKLDYQLGTSGSFYKKKVFAFTPWLISRRVNQFYEELKCSKKNVYDKWFYIVYNSRLPIGFAEIRVQKGSSYMRKSSRCPPDDSNIEQLCKGKSDYSCPNMTFEETNGISVRNVSMYLVTGKPTPGEHCSYNAAQYSQYMGNHYYFAGNNTQSKKMQRTIPVMTKAIKISSNQDPCKKEYQMQFYVNTAHLDTNNMPCPTQAGVMLQKVVNMQIYVKTVNGNPDTDMSQVKDVFTKELDSKNLSYVKGSHYLAQYRGHGPVFGRTLEIWVEKSVPQFETICQGKEGAPVTTPLPVQETTATTAAPPTTVTDPYVVSYY